MPGLEQAWITAAWDNSTCLQATVLAKSLRKVVTNGKLVVLTGPNISASIRDILVEAFDALLDIDLGRSSQNGLSILDNAKISAWKYYWWKKCTFLEPDTLVLKNCDELLENSEAYSTPAFDKNASVFTFQSSYSVYQHLDALVNEKRFKNASELFKSYFKACTPLPSHYFENVSTYSHSNATDVRIVSLSQNRPWKSIEKNGIGNSEKLSMDVISKQWLELLFNDVLENMIPEQVADAHLDWQKINSLKEEFKQIHNLVLTNTITSKDTHNYLQDSIAVIGYSCRFPGSNNREEFWELLKAGGDGITQMPAERLNESQLDDPRFTSVQAGFLKCPIDEFDAKFFGISPREAIYMDPQQRLLTEVAWEAIENAGINPHSLKGSTTGVFTGVWTHEYETLLSHMTSGADFHHVVLGNTYGATSARVSYVLGLNGPNIVTESGCSSSMVSLHLACQSLRKGESKMTLVGGVNLLCAQFPHSEVSILAKDGHCKTFDEKADGFARGEGVGVLVMKKYSDAIRDGDRVMAIIRGTGISQEGTTNSFGTPSKYCQTISIQEAIKDAGVDPLVVDYVEAHGTGTPIGDPIEFGAIAAGYSGDREKPLMIGSVKTNIGHSEAAAGLAGLIKVMMAMENELIPLHRNLDTLNPNINLESVPALIPTSAVEWPRQKDRTRLAGVSSFGISGTNIHVIVQEPPLLEEKIIPPTVCLAREHEILTISAKSEESLKELVQNYISYFEKNPKVNLKDVAFTANNGRAHFKHRIAVVGRDAAEMKANLEKESFISGLADVNLKPVVTFLFTGQGSQYIGMTKSLYESNDTFKKNLDSCATILKNNCTISLHDILWNGNLSGGASIDQTLFSQIAIFCVEYALLKLWESFGIKPDVVLGHSVGEFAAAVAAGVLDLQDAITLVSERSRLIHNLPQGKMLAVRSSVVLVQQNILEFQKNTKYSANKNNWLDIAVINSNDEVVVAGTEEAILAFAEFCKDVPKFKCQLLAATHAFHSRAMDNIMEKFGSVASAIEYKAPICNYISGSTGMLLSKGDFSAEYWQKHARYSVDFAKSSKSLESYGCNTFIEIGAHPILLALSMNNLVSNSEKPYLWIPSIRKTEHEWVTIMNSLGKLFVGGFSIDWKKINCPLGRKKLELPTYPFQRQRFWVEQKGLKSEVSLGGKALHPLLGSKIPSAGNEHIYQNDLELTRLPYLEDHQVANIVILPGAGFLEMILCAGRDIFKATEKQMLFVSQFLIEAPLELDSGKLCRIQTIVKTSEEDVDVVEVKVYLYCNLNGYSDEKGWKCYAGAKVSISPFKDATEDKKPPSDKIECSENVEEISCIDLEIVKSRCEYETTTEEYYKKIPEIGIFFGKTFQSISKVWKGKNEALGLIPAPENAGNLQEYIYHPVVLDAMIQAFGITISEGAGAGGEEKKDLYLPIGIDKFKMMQLNSTPSMYAHVTWTEEDTNGHVTLCDENGKILSVMNGIKLVRTSLTSFLNVINAHNNKLPGMFQEIWRSRDGPQYLRADLPKLCAQLVKHSKTCNIRDDYVSVLDMTEERKKYLLELDVYTYMEVSKTFIEMGWKPIVGETFTAKQLMNNLIISPSFEVLTERYLLMFCEENILESCFDEDTNCVRYTVLRPLMTLREMEPKIQEARQLIIKIFGEEQGSYAIKIFKYVQLNLAEILLGTKTGVSVLFSGEVDAFKLYTFGAEQAAMNEYIAKYIAAIFDNQSSGHSDSILRILEVGGGTAATTSQVVPLLQKKGIPFRYTFTDISNHFLEEAKKKFKDYSGMEYKIYNLEEDPKLQGFCPFQYDVVIAGNVIHATSNIRRTVQSLRHLMAPSGIICLIELKAPIRYVDFVFGPIPGFLDTFTDFDLRTDHCTISIEKWRGVLTECEFTDFEIPFPENGLTAFFAQATDKFYSSDMTSITAKVKQTPNDKPPCFIIFDDNSDTCQMLQKRLTSIKANVVTILHKPPQSKPVKAQSNVFAVDPSNEEEISNTLSKIAEEFSTHTILYLWSTTSTRDQQYISQGLLPLFKFLINCGPDTKTRVLVVTRGAKYIGDQGAVHPSSCVVDGIITSFRNETGNRNSLTIDLDPDNIDPNIESNEIFYEIWSNSSNGERNVAFRNTRKYVARLNFAEKPSPPLRIPTQQRYCLVVPTTKSINDVTYKPVGKAELQPTEVEVAVRATALNFRDIFVILKPDMFKSLFESVGTDFAGIISDVGSNVKKFKVGDQVFGISNNTSVASHVVVPQDLIMVKPKEFNFCDAATLPSVFLTAYFCIVEVANLKKGETILIHVASGGVGLVAIQLAKQIGANIIATAGSKRKRAYLRSIGIKHVFHSRDISYGDAIERVTAGKGVDMVLNSITGPNFKETSLRVCAQNARFVEMGKVNIWQPEDVAKLRQDVHYTIVDLEKAKKEDMETIIDKMDALFQNQSIEPLPYTRFEGPQIKEALNYFLKAQHIGKVVVAMPECGTLHGKQSKEMIFNPESTYLVTGGLGGIGLEVAKWMANYGAKNLVLVARSCPDEKTKEVLQHMNSKGCRTLSYQIDIGNFEECKRLFNVIGDPKLNLPPLRGIIHSAGALSDDFIKNQTWEKYKTVYNAKVEGGWNLHDLTKDMKLEFFILFSSMAGVFGAAAQSNHSAANCFLDSLAKYRYSQGLPVLTIDWGAWSDIGAATNTVYGKEGAFGVKPFTPAQGIASLKYIMTRPFNQIGVLQADLKLLSVYLGALEKYLEEVAEEVETISSAQTAAEADAFWQDIKHMDSEERTLYIRKYLEKIIRKTLKLPDAEQLDEHQNFSEMGLDSLMAVEMRNKLQNVFGKHITINPTSLLDYPTLASLSKHLAEITFTVDIDAVEQESNKGILVEQLDGDELRKLVMEDSVLPDHIKDIGGCVSASNIKTILLTGATGHVGIYLLSELSQMKDIKLICLVRAKTQDIAKKRLIVSLKKFQKLSSNNIITSVEVVLGNVAEKRLGLDDKTYDKLSTDVDCIVHCAAKANHVERYHKSNIKADVRSVNSFGTLHILELASNKRTKRLIYPGSFSSANEFTDEGNLAEKIPTMENSGEGINFGYGLSKLVAEKLIGQAIERGIPCTVFRYPTLTGNSETGHFTLDTNFFMRMIVTFCQLKIAPNLNSNWYSLPVDIAARLTSQLIFQDKVQSGLYNFIQPEMLTVAQCIEASKSNGLEITLVSPEEFEEKVKGSDDTGVSLVTSFLPENISLTEYVTDSCPALKLGIENGKEVYCKSSKMVELVPNFYEMIPDPVITLRKHIDFAKTNGILDSLGINVN